MVQPWWRSAVFYQIYPRSFAAGRGGPVGDLRGVRDHLDHLERLGVDALWLSPFYPSPMADAGYDVSDYTGVAPLFGTLEDFDELLADCHRRGMRLIIDWVPNHTSSQHPWFVESASSRENPKADWYWWRDGDPQRPPNNWRAAFLQDRPAWTWAPSREQWYLHLFLPEQPDLNWHNPEVVEAMHGVLRFWLDRGVDGFRVDVVHMLGKPVELPDAPVAGNGRPAPVHDYDYTHEIVRGLRRLLDSYPGERMMVGEVFLLSTRRVAAYYGHGDELNLAFNFTSLFAPWEAAAWRQRVERALAELEPRQGWPTWVLSNHDQPRHATRYGSDERARAAAVLLLSLRGTPFLYQGEELGLHDAQVPAGQQVDPGGRDGCRAPIPWVPGPGHGWASEPWLPFPPDAAARSAQAQEDEPDSFLSLYRRLLAARRRSAALSTGELHWVDTPDGVLGYRRVAGSEERVALVNFTARSVQVELDGEWVVEAATHLPREGRRYDGCLQPDEGCVLRPG